MRNSPSSFKAALLVAATTACAASNPPRVLADDIDYAVDLIGHVCASSNSDKENVAYEVQCSRDGGERKSLYSRSMTCAQYEFLGRQAGLRQDINDAVENCISRNGTPYVSHTFRRQ